MTTTSEVASDGGVAARLAPRDDADLVILYGGEQMGSLETCGCQFRPRGSLERTARYARAVRRRAPTLLVDPGYWLDDTTGVDGERLREDVALADAWMVRGLEAAGFDALNVSYHDLTWLEEGDTIPAAALSASVRPTMGRALPTHRIVDVGGLRVAITGVTAPGITFVEPREHTLLDPLAALREVLPRLREQADLVVVLAFEPGPQADDLARLPGVDVLIEAAAYRSRWDPVVEGGAVWVRSHLQTMRLGELRLKLTDGRIVGALDRKIDLDERIGADPALHRLTRDARAEIRSRREAVLGP